MALPGRPVQIERLYFRPRVAGRTMRRTTPPTTPTKMSSVLSEADSKVALAWGVRKAPALVDRGHMATATA
ncbi:hypothetical protein GCM10022224_023930 [Nonomuraea antimicrobica]|uniref:Uncharacterized protein n=1 Tax=Nonomuraea antimicrobica TaxID=561173 RepID=A0ABP7BI05_9ACTN